MLKIILDYAATLADLWAVLCYLVLAFGAGCAFSYIYLNNRWARGLEYQRHHERLYRKWRLPV